MSIAGILISNPFNSNSQAVTSSRESLQKEFQQLGEALQSGNLPAAQADFMKLQQNSPSTAATGGPISQAFSQLGKDLQSGNLPAAQQDFSNIQRDLRGQGTQIPHHHHHHFGGGGGSGEQSHIVQLGQDLQAGNISAAQQAYSAVQQSFAAFGANSAVTSAPTLSSVA